MQAETGIAERRGVPVTHLSQIVQTGSTANNTRLHPKRADARVKNYSNSFPVLEIHLLVAGGWPPWHRIGKMTLIVKFLEEA